MTERRAPVLLQICSNDHPPFAAIAGYYEAAARCLGWEPVTLVLNRRADAPEPGFHYLDAASIAEHAAPLLDGRRPVLTVCHRYRAWRRLARSGLDAGPVVCVAHEFGLLRRRQRRLQLRWDRVVGRPPVRFAGVSPAVVEELRVRVRQAELLPNGIDLARADASRVDRAAARNALGLPETGFTVGVVGRLHPKKRPDLALDGFRAAAERMEGARLVFVGDGELGPELRRRARGLPVVFTGFVADAVRLMPALDLLVFPSDAQDAFGMVLIEAMAAGVPVLCGPAPGPRWVLGDAGRAYTSPSAGAVSDGLLEAYAAWRAGTLGARSQAARSRVEREFSVPAAAARLDSLVAGERVYRRQPPSEA